MDGFFTRTESWTSAIPESESLASQAVEKVQTRSEKSIV